jgi:RIO kinase 1
MTDHLTPLLTDGIIDEVVSRLKSGKEADIYLVRRAGEILAAKVYKDRQARSFKNNAGRAVSRPGGEAS